MPEQKVAKEKTKKRGRPAKLIVPHQLSKEVDIPKYQAYRELYYTNDNQLLPLGKIAKRIKEADTTINQSIVQTALDIYFVKMNWKTAYSRKKTDQFKTWLKETVPFSRSYALDLLKCVRELIAHQSNDHEGKELDDALLASVQEVFNKHGIATLREVIHLPASVKQEYLGQLFDPEVTINQDEIIEKKKALKPKLPKKSVLTDHVLRIGNREVLSLQSLVTEDPLLAKEIEKAIERVYAKYKRQKEST